MSNKQTTLTSFVLSSYETDDGIAPHLAACLESLHQLNQHLEWLFHLLILAVASLMYGWVEMWDINMFIDVVSARPHYQDV